MARASQRCGNTRGAVSAAAFPKNRLDLIGVRPRTIGLVCRLQLWLLKTRSKEGEGVRAALTAIHCKGRLPLCFLRIFDVPLFTSVAATGDVRSFARQNRMLKTRRLVFLDN